MFSSGSAVVDIGAGTVVWRGPSDSSRETEHPWSVTAVTV